MRAVLLTGNGGFDRLQLRDDVPVPPPGPGEVLVRVGAAQEAFLTKRHVGKIVLTL